MSRSTSPTATSSTMPKVRCPQCGGRAEFSAANANRPFCSERCRLIDLGAWASDQYAIVGNPLENELPREEDEPVANDRTDRNIVG